MTWQGWDFPFLHLTATEELKFTSGTYFTGLILNLKRSQASTFTAQQREETDSILNFVFLA